MYSTIFIKAFSTQLAPLCTMYVYVYWREVVKVPWMLVEAVKMEGVHWEIY